ncbi:hypothetical protein SAMN05428642_103129 [Flaviramulus basaltis]|uniref:Uncharacterized protein n=1 Tax=Flaviramulus basaltis TaxID=369401 RepID=A0A1K2IM99_9FLAO|nr:hypothetical protein [Flaviramulus basaltis]SFZ93430.1 hypothetical protein SAMN05428642_103129 [Flaviramulus basaltis]
MKTYIKTLGIIILFFGNVAFAQIKNEEKEYIEEVQKISQLMAKHPEKMDSLMKVMDVMDKKFRANKTKTEVAKKQNKNSTNKKSTSHLDRFIISETKARYFKDWQYGDAVIFLVTQPYKPENKRELKVGDINAQGEFKLNEPESVLFDRKVSDFFKCQGASSQIETTYSSPEIGIIPAFFSIKKNGEEIGVLSLATSKQQAYNNSPIGQYTGDAGYRVVLFYVEESVTVQTECARNIQGTDYGENQKQLEIVDSYNLSFQPGWNYVKVAINGSQNVGEVSYYKRKEYSVIENRGEDVKWVFAKN